MGKGIAELVGSAYENWYGEKVFLDCGPDCGLESFVLEQVCPMAAATGKEILYLTNAGRMQEEKERLDRGDAERVLRIMDYAEFEQMVQYHVAYDGQYDYIFAEDCRLLLESQREPAYSALVYDFLMQAERSAVILIGANAKGLQEYLLSAGKLKRENLFVLAGQSAPGHIVFVQKERGKSTGIRLAQELMAQYPGEGIAYFCGSKEKMRLAAKAFRSKASYFYGADLPENTCRVREGRLLFRQDILVADGRNMGRGLCVQGMRHIIADLFDVDQILSCLNALDQQGESICLYIIEYNGTQLRYLRGIYQAQAENLSWFEQMERGEGAEFMRRSQSPRFLAENPMFFIEQADEYGNCRFQVNSRQRAVCEIAIAVLNAIEKQGYRQWVMQALGAASRAQQMQLPRYALDEKSRGELLARIEAQSGKKLAGEELAFFRRYLCEKLGRKSISVSMANTLFEKLRLPYQVRSKKERARTSPYYNQHYWMLERMPLDE